MPARLTIGLLAASIAILPSSLATAADGGAADVCLEVAADALDDGAWASLVTAMTEMTADRSALFPDPSLRASAAAEREAAPSRRLVIDAGHRGSAPGESGGACPSTDQGWAAMIGRAFLDAGADQLLAEAPTTPGIDSSVDIEWFPAEARLVTTLVFAGPLDIPNGTCWLDETLIVEPGEGRAVVDSERGVETSPFAEGACGRFFDHLPDGGAAGQAATLLPVEFELADGSRIRLVTESVRVTEDGVELGGSFA